MLIQFVPRRPGAPAGKLAEVELWFDETEGPWLRGLKLTGLAVWERRDGSGRFLETPGRAFIGRDQQQKTWDFLRAQQPSDQATLAHLRDTILREYDTWAREHATPADATPF